MLLAAFFFSVAGALVKSLARLPFYEVVFFRAFFSILILVPLIRWKRLRLVGSRFDLLLARGVFGALGLLVFFYTLQSMPLASAVTLVNLSPIFTTILASFLLKEHGKPLQYFCLLLAFAGVAMVYGFDPQMELLPTLLGVLGAFIAGLAYNVVRVLRHTEHPLVVIASFPLVSVFLVGPYSLWHWVQPVGLEWVSIVGVGFLTLFAQYGLTKAYQLSEAAKVAKFTYVGSIFSLAIGYFIFEEVIPYQAVLGIGVVIFALLLGSAQWPRRRHSG